MPPSLLRLVISARERFVRAGIPPDQAAIDADVLARHAMRWDRATYLARRDEAVDGSHAERMAELVARRERREPVAYITGVREFWGLEFRVTRDVLIPRPETELVVEAALARLGDRGRRWRIADVGTGSGCLAVSLAHELTAALIVAADVSAAALAVAASNAAGAGVSGVRLVRTSLLAGVAGPFDLIVANLPYIPGAMQQHLMPDVRDFEPAPALYGAGEDGLDQIRALIGQAGARLVSGGWLLVEFGLGQGPAVREAVERQTDLQFVEMLHDLQGHERTIVGRRIDDRRMTNDEWRY